MRNYAYAVNPWPVFVAGEALAAFQRSACALPLLLRKVFRPERSHYFQAVERFYSLSSSEIDRLLAVDVAPHLVTRSDSVLTARGVRTVEVNIGSKVGGWQTQLFDRAYRMLPGLQQGLAACEPFTSHDTLESYIQALVRSCRGLPNCRDGQVKLLFLVDPGPEGAMVGVVASHLSRLAARSSLDVDIRVDSAVDALSEVGGRLMYAGAELHGLLVTQSSAHASRIPRAVFEAFCDGRLIWPDNPVCDSLNEKSLFERFFQPEAASCLTAGELELAAQLVPHSVSLKESEVHAGGVRTATGTFLMERQHDFVLKSSYSAQGRDVYVGRFTSPEEWRRRVDEALGSDSWVAQEYCDSLRFYACDKSQGVSVVSYVLGLFSFASTYGGTWVRLSSEQQNADGVINSARGAQEAIVYECQR